MEDYLSFASVEQTSDGAFVRGRGGVRDIRVPADGRSAFIFQEQTAWVRLASPVSGHVLYPLSPRTFRPPAKAVLMDLDGTSVHSEPFWVWIIERTLQELRGDPGLRLREAVKSFVSGFSVSEHLRYGIDAYCHGASLEEARVGLGLTDTDAGRVIGIEDSSAGVLSVTLAGYAVVGLRHGNIRAAGLEGLLYRQTDDLMELLPAIL